MCSPGYWNSHRRHVSANLRSVTRIDQLGAWPARVLWVLLALVSGGCIVSGHVVRSVLFSMVRVHSFASVNWSVLLPEVQVGRHARLNRTVIDRGCTIPDGMVIGENPEEDARRFYRTASGITLVTPEMLARL